MQLRYTINPRKIGIILSAIAFCLSGVSLFSEFLLEVVLTEIDGNLLSLLDLFSVNLENSIPTWFSSVILFVVAVELALIAHARWIDEDAYRWHWVGLAIIFLYLSIDEGVAIHEYFTDPLFYALNTTGHLYFAWQIVAVPLVILFGWTYVRFLIHLPPKTRYGFVIAAVMYTGGALFFEGLSANYLYLHNGDVDFPYLVIATIEETLEMLGVITFIAVLLAYMVNVQAQITLLGSDDSVQEGLSQDNNIILDTPQKSGRFDVLEQRIQQLIQPDTRPYIIVFLAGINLIIIQWVLVRELTTVLRVSELVIMIITVSYFLGLSIGYRVAGRVKRSWLKPIGIMILFLHLSLPIWFRVLTTWLDSMGAYGIAYFLFPLIVPFIISAFYSIFLPLFVDDGDGQLTSLYAIELMGSVAGILCLVILADLGVLIIFSIYATILMGILGLLGLPRIWWIRVALLAIGWLWFFPSLNIWSNTLMFRQFKGLSEQSRTLFTAYSPYQKVDILQDSAGNRYLYLDGLEHYGGDFGYWLNVLMGRVPATLIEPEKSLVFGAGTMELEWMISNYSGQVTTVEIDPVVVDASLQFFKDYNYMDKLANRTIIIDDAKHFIANTDQTYDLITSALPAAFTIQNGALYSTAFLEQIHAKLNPDGIFVANLTSAFAPDDVISRRITASVLATFDEVVVVTSDQVELSVIFASDNLTFGVEEVQTALETNGATDYAIFETNTVRAILGDAQPITLDSLDVILQNSADRILSQIRGG